MTQRSIPRPHNATANIAVRTLALRAPHISQRAQPNIVWLHTALAALVLVVVVLITTSTGAG